jgi:hypothetical protein
MEFARSYDGLLEIAQVALRAEFARRGLELPLVEEPEEPEFRRLVTVLHRYLTLPRIASVVAFGIAGIVILNSALGQIVILPFALVPLCAGIGILCNRVWGAYGFAAYFFAQPLLLVVILLRPWYATGRVPKIIVTELASLGLGILFLLAGRSLAVSGAARGRAWPWIVATTVFTAPVFFFYDFVATGSMQNTLSPATRGQIVLFISPTERSEVLVKRVIAVPGDHLRIAGKLVILNGTALDEKYVTHEGEEVFYPADFPNAVELPGCAEGA